MNMLRLLVARFALALAALMLGTTAWAQDDDPPARVGRLADTRGQVWLYDQHGGEWTAAARNRPITSGDRLSTEGGARAEVQVGSVAWRLDEHTEMEVLQLDDEVVHLQLYRGSIALRARTPDAAAQVQVFTAEGRFAPLRAGHWRIDRDGSTSGATAWSGGVNFRSDDSELDVEPGQRIEFWHADGRTHYSRADSERDAFADWALAEEARIAERSGSSRYVSPEMPGIEDLDRHGRWERSDDYGALWVPRAVAPGWAPYRYGHWSYVGPWGWSWVDDAPWGFAPFHYGRWVYWRAGWAWVPGAYIARPVFAPALVAWIGGPRVSIGVNVGGSRPPAVGWFPLGPREVYVPAYRVSPRYVRNVNATHVRRIDPAIVRQPTSLPPQRYVNRLAPGAITAVTPDVIERRQPVGRHADARLVRDIAEQPVSPSLPALAATQRAATQPRAAVPPAPHRTVAEPRIVRERVAPQQRGVARQRDERPDTPPMARSVAPRAPDRVVESRSAPEPRVLLPRAAEPRAVEPRTVERRVAPRAVEPPEPAAPRAPAARMVAPQSPRAVERIEPAEPPRAVAPRAPAVVPQQAAPERPAPQPRIVAPEPQQPRGRDLAERIERNERADRAERGERPGGGAGMRGMQRER
jgi:hypothetical protein